MQAIQSQIQLSERWFCVALSVRVRAFVCVCASYRLFA